MTKVLLLCHCAAIGWAPIPGLGFAVRAPEALDLVSCSGGELRACEGGDSIY